jgi:Zn-dependent protease
VERRWEVARIGGIPVFVTPAWLLFVVLIAWLMYSGLAQRSMPDAELLTITAIGTLLFFGGVAVHEAAHAIAARGYGLPVLGITFVFWGGYTETPSASKGPLRHFVISMVGPLSTLVIAFVYWGIGASTGGDLSFVVLWLATLNGFFAIVNSVPALPLDGGHALSAIVWGITGSRRTAERVTGYASFALGIALVVWGFITLRQQGNWWIVMFFIGFQMIVIGRGTEQRVALRDRLRGGRVRDAMRPPTDQVPAGMILTEALERFLRGTEGRYFPVMEDGRVVGSISLRTARPIGAKDPLRPVRDAMVPIERSITLPPDLGLDDAIERIGGYEAMVLQDGTLVGVIGPNDVQRWLQVGAPTDEPVSTGGASAVPVPPRPDRGVGDWE